MLYVLRTTSTVHVTPRLERAMALFQHAKAYGIASALLFGAGNSFKTVDSLDKHVLIAGIMNPDSGSAAQNFQFAQKN